VAVVCATRGEEGEIADPRLASPENLGQVREQELRSACAAVGVTDVSFLGYRDGHLREADSDEATGRIVRHIRRFRPDVVVTFAANGGYGHYDHMAVHRLALAAITAAAEETRYPEQIQEGLASHRVSKVYFGAMPRSRLAKMREAAQASGGDFTPGGNAATIPVEEMGTPDERITKRITTVIVLNDEEFVRKLRALQAHATQMPKDSPWSRATPEELRQYMGRETLELRPAPISDRTYPTPENDVFSGL
jgi:LmbE family N-acetylglucosaminyl deacetylase